VSVSKLIKLLNEKYRFITINIDRHSWSDVDEDEYETPHSTIDIRLSHVGASMDDVFMSFDDVTLGTAVRLTCRGVL